MIELNFSTSKQFDIIDITEEVKKAIKDSKMKNGLVIIYTPHATAAIIINESWDPKVGEDFLDALDRVVPLHAGWRHDTVDNNAAAHIKSAIVGPSEIILLENGELHLGTWQQIALVDFDGPRKRRVLVKIL
ncbi:MAG: YjbQ family protein [Candidatus Woesearchaeota archaeon]|nr:MAG: YjbQ family protein [Candidatus Woesearchaeota archaeon]